MPTCYALWHRLKQNFVEEITQASLFARNGIIEQVGKTDLPKNDRVIDLQGHVVIPGMVNTTTICFRIYSCRTFSTKCSLVWLVTNSLSDLVPSGLNTLLVKRAWHGRTSFNRLHYIVRPSYLYPNGHG